MNSAYLAILITILVSVLTLVGSIFRFIIQQKERDEDRRKSDSEYQREQGERIIRLEEGQKTLRDNFNELREYIKAEFKSIEFRTRY